MWDHDGLRLRISRIAGRPPSGAVALGPCDARPTWVTTSNLPVNSAASNVGIPGHQSAMPFTSGLRALPTQFPRNQLLTVQQYEIESGFIFVGLVRDRRRRKGRHEPHDRDVRRSATRAAHRRGVITGGTG